MRDKLIPLVEQRKTFTGVFARYGSQYNWHGFPERTYLFTDIKDEAGTLLTDHAWFPSNKQFLTLGDLSTGQTIRFDARVKPYTKGYVNLRHCIDMRQVDYGFFNPSKVQLINTEINGTSETKRPDADSFNVE